MVKGIQGIERPPFLEIWSNQLIDIDKKWSSLKLEGFFGADVFGYPSDGLNRTKITNF